MYLSGNSIADAFLSLRDSSLAASPAISQTVGSILVTAIWQGAVVATCLAICLKLTNRISAATRFAIWSVGFLTAIGLPFLPLAFHFASSGTAQAAASAPRPWLQLDSRWSIAICLLWAAASLYRTIDLAVHAVRLRRLWKTAKPVDAETISTAELATPARLWGRKPLQVCTTESLDRPSVIGFFAPRILIPDWLFVRITPGELDQIVLHETEHLRRGDDWTNLLQKLSLVVFPLNPVLLWIERQLCLEREMACDEAVIRVTRAPRAYAACLASLAERGLERRSEALSLGAWQHRSELVHRVHRILLRKQLLGPLGARSVLAALACGLVFGSVELARCPQLIAFAPAQPAESAQLHQHIQLSPEPLVTVSTTASVQPLSSRASAKPYLTELKAVMPVRNSITNPDVHPQGVRCSARKLAQQPSPSALASAAPRQTLLKAEAPAAQPATAQVPDQQQSWIVLTTWEQVETPATAPAMSDTGISQPAPTKEPASSPTQGHFTVTQLIFRVLPAGSASGSPTALPIRGGWLVIQL